MTTENVTPVDAVGLPDGVVSEPSGAQLEELSQAASLYSVGVAYHQQADRLLAAVEAELKALPPEFGRPVRFLHSHAIELYLKAYLRLHGISLRELKDDFGHNLRNLHAASKSRGFAIEPRDQSHVETTIERLKNGYQDYEFRYFEGSIGTVDPDWIQAAALAIGACAKAELECRITGAAEAARQSGKTLVQVPLKAVMSVGGKRP